MVLSVRRDSTINQSPFSLHLNYLFLCITYANQGEKSTIPKPKKLLSGLKLEISWSTIFFKKMFL